MPPTQQPGASSDPSIPVECDIVMQGGVTSGVVYPAFVARLATRFRLRNIGGTSAGAIAASAAAAAQYAANRGVRNAFAELEILHQWLARPAEDGSPDSNLMRLFQADAALRRHFAVIGSALNARNGWMRAFRIVKALLWRFPGGALAGIVPGVLLCGLKPTSLLELLAIVLAALGGALLHALASLVNALPRNGYGLCSGHRPDAGTIGPGPALTDWLFDLQQRLAGLSAAQPLTFGHLWGETATRRIDLAMMTSCLSECRAQRLPFTDDSYVFRRTEFERLFPRDVVDWLCEHARDPHTLRNPQRIILLLQAANQSAHASAKRPDYHLFPAPQDFPVLLATRMSLSFPLLLSAVPVWKIRGESDGEHWQPALKRLWFSDGGLTSNFPIHFFDAFLPQRPTFGVVLKSDLPADADADQRVYLPRSNAGGAQADYEAIDSAKPVTAIFGFLGALLHTMKDWRDEAQRRAPGYRDRVAQIRHTRKEGGLNLNMPAEHIAIMSASGVLAAQKIIDHFCDTPGDKNGWLNHRWVRMRSSGAMLQKLTEEVGVAFGNASQAPSYATLLAGTEPFASSAYRMTHAQRAAATGLLQGLQTLATDVQRVDLGEHAPAPAPIVVIAPR